MSLNNVWLQTLGDGLVRADQIVGINAHQTPALAGKPARWLLDVVLHTSIGSGGRDGWGLNALHRTLIQCNDHPGEAPAELARLLAQLDLTSATGVITASRNEPAPADPAAATGTAAVVRFQFVPFPSPAPGHHTAIEYL